MTRLTRLPSCSSLQRPPHSCNIAGCPYSHFLSWPSLSHVYYGIISFKFVVILLRPSLMGGSTPNLALNLFSISGYSKPLSLRLHKNILWLGVNCLWILKGILKLSRTYIWYWMLIILLYVLFNVFSWIELVDLRAVSVEMPPKFLYLLAPKCYLCYLLCGFSISLFLLIGSYISQFFTKENN